MAKKIILTIMIVLISTLTFATISMAKNDNTTTMIGNEVTSSMNKTERNMSDLVDRTNMDKAGQKIENGARAVGNAITTGIDDIGRGADSLINGNDNIENDNFSNNRTTDNRAVAGTTGNYTTGQIGQLEGQNVGRNGMSQNAWIWIVMIVVALVIVAIVWLYAAQRD